MASSCTLPGSVSIQVTYVCLIPVSELLGVLTNEDLPSTSGGQQEATAIGCKCCVFLNHHWPIIQKRNSQVLYGFFAKRLLDIKERISQLA